MWWAARPFRDALTGFLCSRETGVTEPSPSLPLLARCDRNGALSVTASPCQLSRRESQDFVQPCKAVLLLPLPPGVKLSGGQFDKIKRSHIDALCPSAHTGAERAASRTHRAAKGANGGAGRVASSSRLQGLRSVALAAAKSPIYYRSVTVPVLFFPFAPTCGILYQAKVRTPATHH